MSITQAQLIINKVDSPNWLEISLFNEKVASLMDSISGKGDSHETTN